MYQTSFCRLSVSDLVLLVLVPWGGRFIVTSRPEGVNLERFALTHVILKLSPLSDEQQRTAIAE